jgi:hypothetical protein
MNPGTAVSLDHLKKTRSDEIEGLLRGIRGDADGRLWTRELRPATRGGKPCGVTRGEDD